MTRPPTTVTTCQVSSPPTCGRYASRAGTERSSLWAAFHWATVAPKPVSAGPDVAADAAAGAVAGTAAAVLDEAAGLLGGAAELLAVPEHPETPPTITAVPSRAAARAGGASRPALRSRSLLPPNVSNDRGDGAG